MRKISRIIIHHSVTPRDQELSKSLSSFNRTHKARLHPEVNSLGYHIAYHIVIAWDGSYEQTRSLDDVWYHASNLKVNNESVGICLTGNFDIETPSYKQIETLIDLIDMIQSEHEWVTVHWHNEYASKSCPGKNLDLNKLKEMLFYEKLWNDNYKDIKKDDRMFKDPYAFIDRIEKLSARDTISEMTFLIAILSEKMGKKIDE